MGPMETSKEQNKYLSLMEFDSEEQLICTIKKHPIGALAITLSGILVSLLIPLALGYVAELLLQNPSDGVPPSVRVILYIAGGLLSITTLVFTYIAVYLYRNNILVVTSDKVVQILYKNLIDRKVSQLSLGDLQDITVDQKGLFARIFHYGTLVIETAGEQNNFIFTYAPFPYRCAKDIVGAREASIKKYGN